MQTRCIAVILALIFTLTAHTNVHAQDPNRAGVVVQHGDGEIATACVEFEEPALSGLELLQRSEFEMIYEATSGLTVCALDGEGCQFPGEDCFCQCMGNGPCTYWSYWHLDAETGQWAYSQLGASAFEVQPSTVDGWRWGAGTPGSAPEPPKITFAEICEPAASPTVTVLPTAVTPDDNDILSSVTPEPELTSLASPTARSTPTNAATFTPADSPSPPASTPIPAPVVTASNQSTQYLLFGGLVVALIGIFVWMQRRS